MSYRLDLIGVDDVTAVEEHEDVQATEVGVYIRDGKTETWIPWHRVQVASITDLAPEPDVRQPEVRVVRPRPPARRRAR
ncbi:MAG TPA: hypothetical protein VE465_02025 [Streptosporangiaceae bacterium]|jgi:hypothetical protein|nr:hypothetical protein [Streptosporangiaceae bacterium]